MKREYWRKFSWLSDEQLLKWAELLESGQFDQTRGALHRDNNTHCCLGVLELVPGVKDGYGLELSDSEVEEFTRMNDDEGADFFDIAQYIRQVYLS